jgi:hypothetical protein
MGGRHTGAAAAKKHDALVLQGLRGHIVNVSKTGFLGRFDHQLDIRLTQRATHRAVERDVQFSKIHRILLPGRVQHLPAIGVQGQVGLNVCPIFGGYFAIDFQGFIIRDRAG